MQCLTTTQLPLNLGGTQAAGPCLSPGRAASSPPSPAPGRRRCNGFPSRQGPLSPHVQGTGAQRATVDSCPPRQGTQLPNLPTATRPAEKGPCPGQHRGGGWSPPPRREPEGQWGDGRGEELWGGGATGPCVRVPVCIAHAPSCLVRLPGLCVSPARPHAACPCVCRRTPLLPPRRPAGGAQLDPGAVRAARCEVAGV